jgi:hypothetical protein
MSTLARVQRILSFLLLWFLPSAALADGMVVPTIAYPAKVTIPDQRALICFSNGTERLVIETRFTGAGTNFAWVVPLPSQPVIEEATTGLFPTLQYLFRPEIIHDVPRYYLGILVTIGLLYLFRLLIKYASAGFIIFLVFLFVFLAGLLLPALSGAKRAGISSVTTSQAVSILDRKLVGIFETTTITSRDPKALENWLRENGFAAFTNAEPIITSYIKDNWVFVATKVRRDDARPDTSTPHPLSFTFKTDRPVYPMRLTGLNSQSLSVELYVFGLARAEAPHFKVERCTRPNYPEPPSNDFGSWNWRRSSPETPDIVHPLLRKWVIGSPVATKLVGRLSPADMRDDVWLNRTPFSEKGNHLFSQSGALTIALNWSAGVWAGSLLAVCIFGLSNKRHRSKLSKSLGITTVCCIGLTGLIYLALPKTAARLVKGPSEKMGRIFFHFANEVFSDVANHSPVADVRLIAKNLITVGEKNAPHWDEWSRSADWANWQNYYLGGPLREEDSPGNYTIREVNGQLEFVVYDAEGAEHIQTIGE